MPVSIASMRYSRWAVGYSRCAVGYSRWVRGYSQNGDGCHSSLIKGEKLFLVSAILAFYNLTLLNTHR